MRQGAARIGVDVGGTFTDVVLVLPDGRVLLNKTTTTPSDAGQGVAAGIARVLADSGLDPSDVTEIVHGTTVASNTILQKSGARTGLLTTMGFRDVLEIGRIRTPGMFDLAWSKPEPLVPRRWRLEVTGRIAADGSEVTPLDEAAVRIAAKTFVDEGVEAVAICFINSYVEPRHELRAHAILREVAPALMLTASCEVLPEIKEYERTSTAVVNAYLLPAMRSYLSRLTGRLATLGLHAPVQVMASSGGMIGLAIARALPVFAVGSGPAGGVAGAARLSGPFHPVGTDRIAADFIVFDMGGTTAKAALIEGGKPALVTEYEFRDGISSPSRFTKGAGYMLKVPAIDIAEVGSGGGSIARVDAGGLLQVGPISAGGNPGPACYGLGNDRPTVTDANVVLGLLNPSELAGGSLRIDPTLAAQAIERHVAGHLGIGLMAAAHGIRAVANAGMARAIRAVTVERGRDPRSMTLLAFGGGGPLHAVDLARALGITQVVISPMSGVFSAAGMLAADVEHSAVRAVLAPLDTVPDDLVQSGLDALRTAGLRELAGEGYTADAVVLRLAADVRYLGQSSELTVPLVGSCFDVAARRALAEAFHAAYADTFGYRSDDRLELVNLRLTAVGTAPGRLAFERLQLSGVAMQGSSGHRSVSFTAGQPPVRAVLLPRSSIGLAPIAGPAIIESYDTTIAVPPGVIARAGATGTILIEVPANA